MLKRFLIPIPVFFLLFGCSQVGEEEFATVPLQIKRPLASFDKIFSSPSIGRLSLAYLAPSESGKNVWLLLFKRKIPWKERPENTKVNGYPHGDGSTTLLIVEPTQSAGKSGWLVINTIPLGILWGRKNHLSMRWLEPAKQKGPVLFVNKFSDDRSADYIRQLIALPNGWKQPNPFRQAYSDWQSRIEGASKFDFYSVDKKGFLCVTETHSDYPHPDSITKDTPTITTKYHFWNGSSWKAGN